MNRCLTVLLSLALMQLGLSTAFAQQDSWPRTLVLEDGQVTIYKPRVDKLEGDTLHYRAALAYRENADAEPVFGAGWLDSTISIDNKKRVVRAKNLLLREARFPDGTADIKVDLATRLAIESGQWNLDFPLDELESAIELAEAEATAVEKLNTRPPEIIYRDHPALLVSMNGEPVIRDIENSDYKAVINTPYPLIYNNRHYYLNAARDVWYRADNATGPYRFEARPPVDVVAMVNAGEQEAIDEATTAAVTSANAPEIIVSTKPAELIVTDGPAAFVPLVDDLLVLENSDTDVFMHYSTQHYYTVLAGRWYHADSLNGDWQYQAADDLPEAFANIPKTSEQADSRVFVAGTEEAREAVLDAEVPQAAAVKRGKADVEVDYDGQPVYAAVDGTDMVYIKNTGSTVLKSGGLFYLVEDGVWYVSTGPQGPWQVSDHRPAQVDTILPTSPVYNSKYVYVYAATPEVVYVGYTPGYTGSYVYHNTIFYGTGYYYPAWISPYYYYPRHSTWGFSVAYNSWSGWNYGLSWGRGPFSVGYYTGGYWHHKHRWHHRHFGYWGPRGYRSRPHHYSRRGDRYADNNHHRRNDGRHGNAGNDRGGRDRRDGRAGNDRRDFNERHENLYRDRSQRARLVDSRDRKANATERRHASIRQANNNAANGARQNNYNGVKKDEANRAGPVSLTDLRKKAKNRETNRIESNRDNLLTVNRRDNYQAPGRDTDNRSGRLSNVNRQLNTTERRHASIRQANNNAASGARQNNYNGVKKDEANRAGPVSLTDLRKKAKNRETNRIESNRNNLLADNRRDNYQAPGRERENRTGRRNNISQSELAAKSPNHRSGSSVTRRTPTNNQDNRRGSNGAGAKGETKQSTQPVARPSSPTRGVRVNNTSNRETKQSTQPVARPSSPTRGIRVNNTSNRQPTRARSETRVQPSQQQPRQNIKVRKGSSATTPVRQVGSPKGAKNTKPRRVENKRVEKVRVQASPKPIARPTAKVRLSNNQPRTQSAPARNPQADRPRQKSKKDRARSANRRKD